MRIVMKADEEAYERNNSTNSILSWQEEEQIRFIAEEIVYKIS